VSPDRPQAHIGHFSLGRRPKFYRAKAHLQSRYSRWAVASSRQPHFFDGSQGLRPHLFPQLAVFALHSPAPYVGLIGSRRKISAILARLSAVGRLDGVDLARLHAPIGLDVGAVTHGEIAVAVAAELVAFRRHVLGGLRTKRIEPEELTRIAGRRAARGAAAQGAPPAPRPSTHATEHGA
jgi:hypothetical protein